MKEWLKKHKKMVFVFIILGAAAAVAVNARAQIRKSAAAAMTPVPETAQIEKRTLVESISATGTVVSVEKKEVKADVTGIKVESVQVSVGDWVEAGEVLCTLDTENIEEDLADARTTLAASAAKSQIEVSSSERSLSEAQESRDIEAERASEDVAKAWNDYLEALTDLEEAEADYADAQSLTAEKNGEYEYRLELMEAAKAKMEGISVTGSTGDHEKGFAETKEKLKQYLSSISVNNYDVDNEIYMTADLSGISGSIIAGSDAEDEKTQKIDAYLGTLRGYQSAYQTSLSYQQAQAEYEALSGEVAEWQSKYQTAKTNESSGKAAYESAVTAADSKLEAYQQKVRNQEDTTRSNDSAVSTREDSLATSKLNASTVGLSDRQMIRQYEEQLAECTVTAPISGVITSLSVEAGDTYSGGAIATVEDTTGYEVSAEIDEYDIGKIKEGQKVVIKTNGTGDTELEGTVKEIAPRATTGGTEVTYTVKISVDTPCEELKMDMTAKLSIILESRENVLSVPYDAVQEDEEGNFYLEVAKEEIPAVEGENPKEPEQEPAAESTERIMVTKGIESDYYVEIQGKDVKEGMTVIVPASEDAGFDIQMMIDGRGAMGGF